MKLRNKIFAILAIFCLIASACAVSAANDTNTTVDGQATHDSMVLPPDYAHSEANATNDTSDVDGQATHDSMILPPDYAHSEANMTNATNATGHAAGENTTHANATASHTLPATGNPIVVLLVVGAVLGGAGVLRRKK